MSGKSKMGGLQGGKARRSSRTSKGTGKSSKYSRYGKHDINKARRAKKHAKNHPNDKGIPTEENCMVTCDFCSEQVPAKGAVYELVKGKPFTSCKKCSCIFKGHKPKRVYEAQYEGVKIDLSHIDKKSLPVYQKDIFFTMGM